MKKSTSKRGSVFGTALSPVPKGAFAVALLISTGLLINEMHELDKAEEKIVQYESSLKHQKKLNSDLDKEVSGLEEDKMDLKSKNDKLLKDNAKLNQKLKSEGEKISQLKQKLKQTESELQAKK